MLLTQTYSWIFGGDSYDKPIIHRVRFATQTVDLVTPLILLTLGILGACKVLPFSPSATACLFTASLTLGLPTYLIAAVPLRGTYLSSCFGDVEDTIVRDLDHLKPYYKYTQ